MKSSSSFMYKHFALHQEYAQKSCVLDRIGVADNRKTCGFLEKQVIAVSKKSHFNTFYRIAKPTIAQS